MIFYTHCKLWNTVLGLKLFLYTTPLRPSAFINFVLPLNLLPSILSQIFNFPEITSNRCPRAWISAKKMVAIRDRMKAFYSTSIIGYPLTNIP